MNNSAQVLIDPNIFIGNTGATSDTTNLRFGFTNVMKATSKDNNVDALGIGITGSIVGDLSGVICDKNGNKRMDVKVQDM
eukprot:11309656-Ditylum_brightwellii.AAC.1